MNDLACAAEVSLSSVRRLESAGNDRASVQTCIKVQRTFEAQGIIFVADGRGHGVFLTGRACHLTPYYKIHVILRPRT